jgi:hypothetical protein
MFLKNSSGSFLMSKIHSSSFNKTRIMRKTQTESKFSSTKYSRLESNKTEFKHKVEAIRKKLAGRETNFRTGDGGSHRVDQTCGEDGRALFGVFFSVGGGEGTLGTRVGANWEIADEGEPGSEVGSDEVGE